MHATDAFVLKKLDIGEADVLYALYTRDFGKVVARAQGIRKNEAKLRGHLEPFSLSVVRLISARHGEKLIGASLVRFGERMRSRDAILRSGVLRMPRFARLIATSSPRMPRRCFAKNLIRTCLCVSGTATAMTMANHMTTRYDRI